MGSRASIAIRAATDWVLVHAATATSWQHGTTTTTDVATECEGAEGLGARIHTNTGSLRTKTTTFANIQRPLHSINYNSSMHEGLSL